jgi:amino acid transporter
VNANAGVTQPSLRRPSGSQNAQWPDADADRRPSEGGSGIATVVGWAAVGFSALYLLSDLLELGQGGFSTPQLVMTYVAEAAIPVFVLGLYAVQRPRIGWQGLVSAVLYAYTFVYFTSTVVYALVERTSDWQSLQQRLGVWLTVHSVLMLIAGVGFGIAVIRARVFPRWTGATLIAGMLLMVITSSLRRRRPLAYATLRSPRWARHC